MNTLSRNLSHRNHQTNQIIQVLLSYRVILKLYHAWESTMRACIVTDCQSTIKKCLSLQVLNRGKEFVFLTNFHVTLILLRTINIYNGLLQSPLKMKVIYIYRYNVYKQCCADKVVLVGTGQGTENPDLQDLLNFPGATTSATANIKLSMIQAHIMS